MLDSVPEKARVMYDSMFPRMPGRNLMRQEQKLFVANLVEQGIPTLLEGLHPIYEAMHINSEDSKVTDETFKPYFDPTVPGRKYHVVETAEWQTGTLQKKLLVIENLSAKDQTELLAVFGEPISFTKTTHTHSSGQTNETVTILPFEHLCVVQRKTGNAIDLATAWRNIPLQSSANREIGLLPFSSQSDLAASVVGPGMICFTDTSRTQQVGRNIEGTHGFPSIPAIDSRIAEVASGVLATQTPYDLHPHHEDLVDKSFDRQPNEKTARVSWALRASTELLSTVLPKTIAAEKGHIIRTLVRDIYASVWHLAKQMRAKGYDLFPGDDDRTLYKHIKEAVLPKYNELYKQSHPKDAPPEINFT